MQTRLTRIAIAAAAFACAASAQAQQAQPSGLAYESPNFGINPFWENGS